MLAQSPDLQANLNNIPLELQNLNQWVCWRYEDVGAAKPTKVPYHPNGNHASVSDPSTWASFKACCEALDRFDGIGFVFTENDPYCFIDLDATSDWLALERQHKIFREFDTYSERSPSGKGLHIIGKGKIPSGRKRSCIEIYSSARYATFTGDVYANKPINDVQDLLTQLWEQMGAASPSTSLFTGSNEEKYTDEQIIQQALDATNGEKFKILLEGNWQSLYQSQSEADFAFIDIIAFYSQNRKQIQRLFRASKLGMRDKAKRVDYVEWMINKSFDKMLPPVDLDGIKIAIEKTQAHSLTVKPVPHKNIDVGSTPTAPTNAPSSNSRIVPFEGKDTGANPVGVAKRDIQLPPGLLGEIAQFIYNSAPRPVPEIALAGAIGLMAGIAGRSYNVSATGLNQYVLLVAQTGRGKEAITEGIHKLINAVKQQVPTVVEFLGPDEIASGQALYKYLSTSTSFVSILSEFGLRLMQMADADGGSPSTTLRRMFLQLYMKSGFTSVANPSIYSDKDRNIAAIQSPAFSIVGESTPHRFYQNISEEMIMEGLLPRFLTIEYDGKRPPQNRGHDKVQPNFGLVEKLVTLAANSKTVQNASPRRVINVNFTPEAQRLSDEWDTYCDNVINSNETNPVIVELWNRAHLKMLKLAATVAVGVNMYDPLIEPEHINWAIELIKNDIETLTRKFEGGHIGATTSEVKQVDELLSVIKMYLTSNYDHVQKYLTKDEKSRVLYENKVIPYSFISRRLIAQTSFKSDRLGSTTAIKRCLQILIDRDAIREMSRSELMQRFGTYQKSFVLNDFNLLK